MKRFLKHIVFWMMPVLAAVILVWQIEVPNAYRYLFAKNEGCDIEWIAARIENQEASLQLVFMGASHTGCGVNDRVINKTINLPNGAIANLSYCGGNRNIHAEVLKDLLERHKPQKIILDVVRDEPKDSHRDYGFIADTRDVFNAPMLYNGDYLRDVLHNFQVHFFYLQDLIFNRVPVVPGMTKAYGFNDVFHATASENELEKFRKEEEAKYGKWQSEGFGFWEAKKQNVSLTYIEEFAGVCADAGVELSFLYIPAYGMVAPEPMHAEFYRQHGDLIIPPQTIFRNPEYWIDNQHLNSQGSKQFSIWLAQKLKVE